MLRIENLRAGYGKEEIIKGISVEFAGKTLLLGPNGAGKTTLFRTICGLIKKFSGKIYIDGRDLETIDGELGLLMANISEIYRLMYVPAYWLAVAYLDLLEGDINIFREITEGFGLSMDLLKRKFVHELSAGQQKIFYNAITLATNAKVKLFDEPFEQLDPKRKDMLIECLESDKAVNIVSTHETWLLKKLDASKWDVVFMFEGMLFGKIKLEELLDAYLIFEYKPDALLAVKTPTIQFSIVKEPIGKPLEDILSLDYIYKLA